MPRDPDHPRHSIRLRGYDYAQAGGYFLTLCTHDRHCWFGTVEQGQVRLNRFGRIVKNEWFEAARVRSEIRLDAFVVMPNHFHGIVFLETPLPPPADPNPALRRPRSLSTFVNGFKSAVTTKVNQLRGTPRQPLWQRNYFERILRDQRELLQVRQYIEQNPIRWDLDPENPERQSGDS